MRILALSGSLRAESSNVRLLRAAARFGPDGARFTFYDQQIAALPHFSPDLDAEGAVAPPPVAELRHLLAAADGVLICSHAGSIVTGSST
jgi:NAD(P)H-dependent FMN reductase